MAEPYPAMQFMDPEPELLYRIRDEAEEYFGEEYSMELVNHDFTSDMLESFNEKAGYKRRTVDGLVPEHPIEMVPTVDNDVANYFRISQLSDILNEGSFMVRVAAYHEDFNPGEADLYEVHETLQEGRSSVEDITKSVKVEDYLHNENLRENALNRQFEGLDPLKMFFAEVPIQMADSDQYVDAFKDALMVTYSMDEVENLDTFFELQRKSMSFDEIHKALRAEDYTDANTSINTYLNNAEGNGRYKMGLANGLGVEGADRSEAVFRVEQPGGRLSETCVQIVENLESNGLPVGGRK